MVRIKGENSDYRYCVETGQIQEVPRPDQLYLQIFLCPHDHPSRVEVNDGEHTCCKGVDRLCPEGGDAPGHALIRLDEKTGISLVTDRQNQIILTQNGSIQLCPSADGQVEVRHSNGQTVLLDLSDRGITMQLPDAGKIQLDRAGNIELTPGSAGKVTVNGDLTVQGNLHAQIDPDLKRSLIEEIKRSLVDSSVQSLSRGVS